ncbi:hypothetical protein [Brevibacillus laterosporus]|uniref:hypothetical protein n=1 Tax=Brevibacillus laterosporus TaxID=1465 RepID=UPI0018F86AAF|nr:hypothetical protein [Brevibacillus laterosporus]
MKMQMATASLDEMIHLLQTMKESGVKCSLEIYKNVMANPFIEISNSEIDYRHLQGAKEDYLAIILGGTELSLDLDEYIFFKHINDYQILLGAVSDDETILISSNIFDLICVANVIH